MPQNPFVRVALMAMFVMLAAPRAEACPHGTVCVSAETRIQMRDASQVIVAATRHSESPAQREIPRPRSMLQVAMAHAESPGAADRLTASLRMPVTPRTRGVEMPWIWVQLRRSVYDRMPRYERRDPRALNRFSLVMSPVVVSSPQDTVPGVGLEGEF